MKRGNNRWSTLSKIGVTLFILGIVFCGAADGPELTGLDLLAEYDRLVPINKALRQGDRLAAAGKYPRGKLGSFNSMPIEEAYRCGDLCPQEGRVFLRFVGVSEADCEPLGEPLYLMGWGPQFVGCSPLIVETGVILTDKGYPVLSFERLTGSTIELPLAFDDHSVCTLGRKRVSCDEIPEKQRAAVKGFKTGVVVTVLRLQIQS
jgi:hypothetical protein